MWIVPSEFSKALDGLAKLGGADGDGRSWMDVDGSANGAGRPTAELDTSGWFESALPRAADQPEAKIELSSIADTAPAVPAPAIPDTTSLARAAEHDVAVEDRQQPPG